MSASRSLTKRLQGAKMLAEEQAHSDTLTGLRNRRSLERILDHLAQTKESFSLIQIDLARILIDLAWIFIGLA